MTTVKIEDLTNVGTIANADKLVGERVDGTTVRITYSDAGSTNLTTVGTVTVGTWNAATIAPGYGGTGITSYTTNAMLYATGTTTLAQLTPVANAVLSYNGSGVPSASTTLPSGLTIPGYQATITPAALTKTDDTNVTLTLGGTPTTALLQAASITAGWTGQLGLTRGGTAANLTASNGGIVYSNASALAVLAGTATANKMLLSGSSTTPTWSTSTIPTSAGATANKVLLSDGYNYVLSTPTFPNASATSGKIIKSDGTNWVASTETYPAPSTSGKIIKSDGTNWVASTETYPAPSTSGNILQSDGTNWTSASPTGTGVPVLATSPTLVTPVLGAATATSINFGGSTLSTYTTGTWTPVLTSSGGGTFTTSFLSATYTIIGNRIMFDLIMNLSGVGSAGNLTITGLPKAAVNYAVCSFYLAGAVATATVVPMAYVQGTTISLFKYTAGSTTTLTTANVQIGTQIILSGVC